jgi:hypothetical protein
MIRKSLGCYLAAVGNGAVLLLACTWCALCLGQASDLPFDQANEFPVTTTAEVVRGRSQRVTIDFNVYFSVDDKRYVPVKPELAKLLSVPPEVHSEPGLRVRTISAECTPRKLTVFEKTAIVTVTGGSVRCEIEITPESFMEPGTHEVTLSFDAIEAAFLALKTNLAEIKPEARVAVLVWESAAAKQEAERKIAEEKQRREEVERVAQQAAEAARQREAELAAERRWQIAMAAVKYCLIFLAAATPVGLALFAGRKVLWPRLKATVAAGQCRQYIRCMPAREEHASAEPGTIFETLWATDWRGRRQRIKVEVFVAEDSSAEKERHEYPAMAAHDGMLDLTEEPSEDPHVRRHDVLVAVGASVPRGLYLAACPAGAVRIMVPG